MSKVQFARKYGASCSNPNYAWSYINEDERFVIFGVWEHEITGSLQPIFSFDWEFNANTHRNKGFRLSLRHIEKIVEDGFRLFTFIQIRDKNSKNLRYKKHIPKITEKSLLVIDSDYYAAPLGTDVAGNKNIMESKEYKEGKSLEVVQTIYERNPEARAECLRAKGYSCEVCGFNFESKFDDLGRGFIHVHHIIPVSQRKTEYTVNPIEDLVPVCPNCHAMLHKRNPPISVEELSSIMAKASRKDAK